MEKTRMGAGMLRLAAVYTQGKLLLAAAGSRPTPNDRVFFEPEVPFADPPRFALRGNVCPTPTGGAVPYQVVMLFAIVPPPEEVVISYGTREERVPVLVPADVEALNRWEPVPLVRMALTSSGGLGINLPAPFLEMLEGDGEPVPPPILWPIRLGALFDGRLERAPADPRRATGYSDRFDFGEAFRDALRSLPADLQPDAETLTTVHVTEMGALVGGVGGGQRMFVSVLAY
jgi:hypothetical protein